MKREKREKEGESERQGEEWYVHRSVLAISMPSGMLHHIT